MFFGNNSCIWIILIIIVLFCCCGNGGGLGCGNGAVGFGERFCDRDRCCD